MKTVGRVAVILRYELRRALAKRTVLALIIIAASFQILTIVALAQFRTSINIGPAGAYIWILGMLEGQGFFVPLITIIIAGSAMSDEYEHGTADILLSKPITRAEYMFGKFLGGLSLLILVEALMTVLGVILSTASFGFQDGLQYAPILLISVAYSSLTFFTLSFMFSEVLRRSNMAVFGAFAVLIASTIIGQIMAVLHMVTGNIMYLYVSMGVPTWGATNLPPFLIRQLSFVPSSASSLLLFLGQASVSSETGMGLAQTVISVTIYAAVFVVLALYRLLKSDVTKKAE